MIAMHYLVSMVHEDVYIFNYLINVTKDDLNNGTVL